jgi:putative cofactor-binding repeat protein
MASGPGGFATIVSFGGELRVVGDQAAPVRITSWDAAASMPDRREADGRAYLRAIGGRFEARHVSMSDLGFWSGRTGGLALTGTDRPNTGAIESGGASASAPGTLLDDVTWQPAGPLKEGQTNPTFDYSVDAVSFVSTMLDDVSVSDSAFGVFVSGAAGVQITNSTFEGNRFGGVVLHRHVTNGAITATTSTGNGGDGFSVGRTTTGISISESTASRNAGSGFHVDGRALTDAPSVVGASLRPYGNNSITASSASDNGRYGIHVRGGFNIGLQNNLIEHHDMGIMVGGPAERISVTGNRLERSERHGIGVVDGVRDAVLTGNVVAEARTGIYVRDSSATITGNTIESANAHAVSLVGSVGGSEVSFNVLAGEGASALDTRRSGGDVAYSTNNVDGWRDTTPWYVWFKRLLQPANALWTLLALLIVISAVRSRRANGVITHPYAHQMSHHGVQPAREPAADTGKAAPAAL